MKKPSKIMNLKFKKINTTEFNRLQQRVHSINTRKVHMQNLNPVIQNRDLQRSRPVRQEFQQPLGR